MTEKKKFLLILHLMIDRCYIEITNVCNLSCDFCPKHNRQERRMSAQEFDLVTDRLRGRAIFLYFHLMGEPMLHPLLPDFIRMAREKGFKTVLTSNGTLPVKAMRLLSSLPHKVQLSLHSHESNGKGILAEYIDKVMQFAIPAAEQGTCIVLRLWNQGGRESENEQVMQLLEKYVQKPWHERPDGYRLCDNLYLEFDRKFRWPEVEPPFNSPERPEVFCKALHKQIGVLSDGSLVPCCMDHNGDIILGNLFIQSLDEILESPRAKAMIEGFRHHKATEQLCRNCESGYVRNSFRGKPKS
ncbi:MAG: SPASM domain-containing protein [Prevotella sp.]|nr:SPASM domain-containing protein [Prevotella sp.]